MDCFLSLFFFRFLPALPPHPCATDERSHSGSQNHVKITIVIPSLPSTFSAPSPISPSIPPPLSSNTLPCFPSTFQFNTFHDSVSYDFTSQTLPRVVLPPTVCPDGLLHVLTLMPTHPRPPKAPAWSGYLCNAK